MLRCHSCSSSADGFRTGSRGARQVRAAALMALLTGAGACARGPNAQRRQPVMLGANLPGVTYYDRTYSFVDAIKSSNSPFGSAVDIAGGRVPLDADGWPTADFGILVMAAAKGIEGTYKLSFTGKADVLSVASEAEVRNIAYDPVANRTTADVVVPPIATQMFLAFTNTNGGARNVKLVRPGYAADTTELFTKPLLEQLKPFRVIRFMDWTSTNNSIQAHWSDRARPSDAQITKEGVGVPWEYAIALSNQLGADMWVNVPALADDNYVLELAKLLAAGTERQQAIYVEYSNEVWNFQFKQAIQNLEAAVAEVSAGGSPLNADGEPDKTIWAWRRTAKRSKEISDIFRSVFGEQAFEARIRPVLAGQGARPDTINQGLDFVRRTYGPPKNYFHAIAVAPYFDMSAADTQTTLTPEQVLAALSSSVDDYRTDPSMRQVITRAYAEGLQPVLYESGPDTFGPNNIEAKKVASADARMKDICVRYIGEMFGRGVGLMNWFTAGATNWDTAFGTWGLTDDMRQLGTAKFQAIQEVARTGPPPLSFGAAVPGEIDARAHDGNSGPYIDPDVRYLPAKTRLDYVVRTSSAGRYQVRVSGVSATASSSPIELHVNGEYIATLQVPAVPQNSVEGFAESDAAEIALREGANGLRLVVPTERPYNLNAVRIYGADGRGIQNTLPTITNIDFQPYTTLNRGVTFSANFSVGDAQTPAGQLAVKASSDNTALVPENAIRITRNAQTVKVDIAPNGGPGNATVTLAVTDFAGLTRQMVFNLAVR